MDDGVVITRGGSISGIKGNGKKTIKKERYGREVFTLRFLSFHLLGEAVMLVQSTDEGE